MWLRWGFTRCSAIGTAVGDDRGDAGSQCDDGYQQAATQLATSGLLDDALLGAVDRKRRSAWLHDIDFQESRHEASMYSSMLDVKINRSDAMALHEQVAAEIRRAIAHGEARTGERLPPARDFAAVLGVNTNTVLRALRLLRDEGLLEFRRGHGIHVAGTPERGAVLARATELVQFARAQGYRRAELIEIIRSLP